MFRLARNVVLRQSFGRLLLSTYDPKAASDPQLCDNSSGCNRNLPQQFKILIYM